LSECLELTAHLSVSLPKQSDKTQIPESLI